MNNKILKYVLYGIFAVLGVMVINAWQRDYPPAKIQSTQTTSNANGLPTAFAPSSQTPSLASTDTAAPSMPLSSAHSPSAVSTQSLIHIRTNLLSLSIASEGGNIVSAHLLKYPVSTEQKHKPVQLLDPNQDSLYVTKAGLMTPHGDDPVVYHATSMQYQLQPGQDTLKVTLKGQTKNGLRVEKVYTVTRGSYAVHLRIHVENASAHTWAGGFFHNIIRKYIPVKHAMLHRSSFSGASISTKESTYHKITFRSLADENLNQTTTGGWVAMQQPYFLTSWVPVNSSINNFYSRSYGDGEHGAGNTFVLGYVSQELSLAPGAKASNGSILYLGPELTAQLNKVSPTLSNTIDYGWLAPISKLIFWLMKDIFKVIGNWGWTIVLITAFIKVVFYYLSDKSYRSMSKMREAQPRIKALQDRYKDDKQALQKATMEFYKKEKLNPVSGCLPMVIQMPIFFALYYVLIESVQLRQAPFIFWIHDLSARDPYFILPIIMGASMLLQQKLSPPPPDPTQAKMMMIMPIMFTVLFLWFPAGLALYMVTNNLLSIAHQYYVMKTYDPKKEKYKKRDKQKKKR